MKMAIKIVTEGRLTVADDSQAYRACRSLLAISPWSRTRLIISIISVGSSSRFSLGDASLRTDNQDDPSIPLEWSYQDQAPGNLDGVISFKVAGVHTGSTAWISSSFQQAFAPNQTTLKVSLFPAGDDPNPLAEVSADSWTFPNLAR